MFRFRCCCCCSCFVCCYCGDGGWAHWIVYDSSTLEREPLLRIWSVHVSWIFRIEKCMVEFRPVRVEVEKMLTWLKWKLTNRTKIYTKVCTSTDLKAFKHCHSPLSFQFSQVFVRRLSIRNHLLIASMFRCRINVQFLQQSIIATNVCLRSELLFFSRLNSLFEIPLAYNLLW